MQKLKEKVRPRASFELDSLHLLDACSAIISAIEAAQSIDTEAVKNAIDSGKSFGSTESPLGFLSGVYGNNHCAEHQTMMSYWTKDAGLQFKMGRIANSRRDTTSLRLNCCVTY